MKSRAFRVRLCLEELEQRWVPSTAYSTNWAGYAVSGGAGTVTAVSGTWMVPKIVAGSSSGYSSAWVGIDGYNSNSVEQLGTDSDMVNGVPQYYAWWEMYPNPSYTITSMKIQPGDTISASVTYTSGGFVLYIADGSQTFQTTQSSSSAQRSSAEWIQEAPSSYFGVLPLSDFGTINFSNSQATISGTTGQIDAPSWSSQSTAINMVTSRGALKASTSSLADSGNPTTSSFSVTWVSSGSGGRHGGGRSAIVPVSQPNPALSGALSEMASLMLLASRPAVQPATVVQSSGAAFLSAPVSQGLPFSSLVPARLTGTILSPSIDGGADSQTPLPQVPPTSGEAVTPAVPMANPDTIPAPPAAPTPLPASDSILPNFEMLDALSLPQERRAALIHEGEAQPTSDETARSLIFFLALGGGCGLTRERVSDRRRRPFLN
jgi:hypothetical protein